MRRLPLSGLLFVACFAAAVGLYGNGAGSDPTEISAYYASGADRLRQIGGFACLLAGCIFLLVYVVVLVREVVPDPLPSALALVSGGAATVSLAAGNALWAASAFTAELEHDYRMSASTHLLTEDAGFVLVVTASALAIPFVAVVSLVGARTGRLPTWFGWLGAAAVLGLAAAYWYWPLAAFLAWVACGSVLLSKSSVPRIAGAPVTVRR